MKSTWTLFQSFCHSAGWFWTQCLSRGEMEKNKRGGEKTLNPQNQQNNNNTSNTTTHEQQKQQ